MDIIRPIDIKKTDILSSNIQNQGFTEWESVQLDDMSLEPQYLSNIVYHSYPLESGDVLYLAADTYYGDAAIYLIDQATSKVKHSLNLRVSARSERIAVLICGKASEFYIQSRGDTVKISSSDLDILSSNDIYNFDGLFISPDNLNIIGAFSDKYTKTALDYNYPLFADDFRIINTTSMSAGASIDAYNGYASIYAFEWIDSTRIALSVNIYNDLWEDVRRRVNPDDFLVERKIDIFDTSTSSVVATLKVLSNGERCRYIKKNNALDKIFIEIFSEQSRTSRVECFDYSFTKIGDLLTHSDSALCEGIYISNDDSKAFITSSLSPKSRVYNSSTFVKEKDFQYNVVNITNNSTYGIVPSGNDYFVDYATGNRLSQVGRSYDEGDKVVLGDVIYESLTTSNTSRPDIGANAVPQSWLPISLVNELRFIDNKSNSASTSGDGFFLRILPTEPFDSIGLINLDTEFFSIRVLDSSDNVVYDTGTTSTVNATDGIVDWFLYFNEPYGKERSIFVYNDIPNIPGSTIEFEAENSDGASSLGELVVGNNYYIGYTIYGTSISIDDYSIKGTDEFGNSTIVERPYKDVVDYDVDIPSERVLKTKQILTEYRAKPALWVGDKDFEEIIVYGFYNDFDIILSNYALARASISVESL